MLFRSVAKLIHEVSATIQPLVAKNGNQLAVDCPPDVGRMKADQTKVRQILYNLLSNASKFTEKGVIRLGVNRNSDASTLERFNAPTIQRFNTFHFRITDSGIGMTPAQLAKLFQPFTQAEASTARKYGGTGLGLTITKRFCEMMGGSIQVESELGKGSTFTMELPATVKPGTGSS